MIAGHFGFAAVVKSRAPSVPTWLLMLATVWLDLVFAPLFIAGVETMKPLDAANPSAYGAVVIFADYTHSLLGALVISSLFAAVVAWRLGRNTGLVAGAVVFSHWVLDLPMHRHDMPLFPKNLGSLPRLGFGLWQWPTASAALELALVIVGAVLYWQAASRVAAPAGEAMIRRAKIVSAVLAVSGVVTLALNVVGL